MYWTWLGLEDVWPWFWPRSDLALASASALASNMLSSNACLAPILSMSVYFVHLEILNGICNHTTLVTSLLLLRCADCSLLQR